MRCLSWKEDILTMGDDEGRIVVWNLSKRRSKEVLSLSHSLQSSHDSSGSTREESLCEDDLLAGGRG